MKYSTILVTCAVGVFMVACGSSRSDSLTKSGIDPENFNTVIDGKDVALYTLTNVNGMEACISNYGGRLVSLMVPDKEGEFRDVVLGFDTIGGYTVTGNNWGALIGRYANRIKHGKFTLNGEEYILPVNNFGHCLHGGEKGFQHQVWTVENATDSTLHLSLTSPDGDAGFPGNVKVDAYYKLTADNALDISYEATTDKPTVLNFTHHAYFNLSGDPSRDIEDELLWIDANFYTPVDSTYIPTGEIRPVENSPFDFRKQKTIGRDINVDDEQLRYGGGYDHNYVLNSGRDKSKAAAIATDPDSGIRLEVYTEEPGLQFYSGNFLDGSVTGKNGIAYPRRSAFCLETQIFPDTPNHPEWPTYSVVNPEEKYTTRCVYKFSVAE